MMGSDFWIHGFDNAAAVRSIMRPGVLILREIPVFVVFRRCFGEAQLSRLVSRTCVFELGPFPETEQKKRQKCCCFVVVVVVVVVVFIVVFIVVVVVVIIVVVVLLQLLLLLL